MLRFIVVFFAVFVTVVAQAVTPQVAAGTDCSMTIKSDGTVWGFGHLSSFAVVTPQPVRMFPAFSDVVAAACGGAEYALRSNGSLWSSGVNWTGQLGDGTTGQRNRSSPYKVLDGVVQFAASSRSAIALKDDGTVWAWGENSRGQIGDGTQITRLSPVKVSVPGRAVMVAGGDNFGAALLENGTVWAWGLRLFTDGQANDYSRDDSRYIALTPRMIPIPAVVVSLKAQLSALALDTTGKLWSFGWPAWPGNGTFDFDHSKNLPVAVLIPGRVLKYSPSEQHCIAVTEDGTTWGWGNNSNGRLGPIDVGLIALPRQIPLTAIASELAVGANHSAVLLTDGQLLTFGDNTFGQLGRSLFKSDSIPSPVSSESGAGIFNANLPSAANLQDPPQFTQVEANNTRGPVPLSVKLSVKAIGNAGHSISRIDWVTDDGTQFAQGASAQLSVTSPGATNVYAVATDDSGLQGVATVPLIPLPTAVAIQAKPQIVSGPYGGGFAALTSDGKVFTWGVRWALGSSDLIGASTEDAIALPQFTGIHSVVSLASNLEAIYAITSNGGVLAWGSNGFGSLGNASSAQASSDPVAVKLPLPAKMVVGNKGGNPFSLALLSDGTVWSWGSNESRQLGLLDTATRSQPVQIPGLTNIVSVGAGTNNGFATDRTGQLWAWGDNSGYQLGQGDRQPYIGAQLVKEVPAVAKVAAGGGFVLAITHSGKVYGWGGYRGVLGDVSIDTPVVLPKPIPALASFVDLASSNSFTIGVKKDGSTWAWGDNRFLAIPSSIQLTEPSPLGIENISFPVSLAPSAVGGAIVGNDGLVTTWGLNSFGQIGDGTLARRPSPVLVANPALDGFLNLGIQSIVNVPIGFNVPFFVDAKGSLSVRSSVSTTTKFNPSDKGKSGSVFVTAMVPSGSLGAATIGDSPPNRVFAATPQALESTATCPAPVNPLTLIQLTPNGWQTVVNGQLIPYASGVLGDQLAAQTILNGTDTTNLKGAEFCVGYGTSAQDMVNNGNIRAVATIPGATTTSTCVVGSTLSVELGVAAGWNLLGNPINQSIAVASKFGDSSKVNSVWKWDTTKANWQFYSPGLDAAALQSYATTKGYGVLTEISPGDGYWVHAKVQADLGSMCGPSINLRQSSLSSGWNLVSTASPISAKEFNLTLSTTPPTAGQVPINMTSLWAWDANQANWYFYAPSLDAQGGTVLRDYINANGYLDFLAASRTLSPGVGFWVNKQ